MSATKFASLLIIMLALNYSQQTRGVCVFDLDGTLIMVKNKQLSRDAVKACRDKGFGIAINTAEPTPICSVWQWVQGAKDAGVEKGVNVPTEMWMCRGMHLHKTSGKIANMKTAMKYYNSSAACMVLFDDKTSNVSAIRGAGFKAQQINRDGQGISASELTTALNQIRGCSGGRRLSRKQN